MKHSFSEVPRVKIPRSSFDRSHGYKTTFDADYLIPVLLDDVVPGDTFKVNMNFLARLTSPTLLPLLDNMFLESFFFFVPYRLIWRNFEKFHGAQDDPGDSISFTIPVTTSEAVTIAAGDLGDYFGLPYGFDFNVHQVSALPARAYKLIWDEWFRDENLQDAEIKDGVFGTDWGGDGTDGSALHEYDEVPLKRGKRHDYFTSCLPWPQKGTAVSLPLGTIAPLQTTGSGEPTFDHDNRTDDRIYNPAGADDLNMEGANAAGGYLSWNDPALEVDLSTATAATINELRLAFQTQRLLERDARSGTRYNEMILAHFGVTVPDFRVQRPEFLGGGSSPVNISPVAQTTYQGTPTAKDAKGALSGIGTVSGRHGFTKSFTEHGLVIGLVNVRGDITYCQGAERYWWKTTRYEFYYPVLAQIGEQAVECREIFDSAADPDGVFGYQERYSEYRYKLSRLTGLMNTDASGTLAAMHLGEDFAAEPSLNAAFITSNTGTPLDRALSVPSEPQFVFDAYFEMKCARPMPLFGVPGNLDHF